MAWTCECINPNIIENNKINASTDLSQSLNLFIILQRTRYTIKCGEAKKLYNNMIRKLSFVILLLILSEALTVDLLCKAFDVRIVLIWRNATMPIIIPSSVI